MNKGLRGVIILLGACALMFSIMVYAIIPRAAGMTLPYRWANIPLQQPRVIVRQYLGRPADTSVALTDAWLAKRQSGEYVLKVIYGNDTLSASYKLYFNYHLGFFHKQYLLAEK